MVPLISVHNSHLSSLCIPSAAIVDFEDGGDFKEVETDVVFPAQTNSINVSITLGPDDIFPGEDKVFEVYLGPAPGTYISPTAHVTVIIVDPDPELPGKDNV